MNLDQTRPGRKPQDQAKQWKGSNMNASAVLLTKVQHGVCQKTGQ